MRTQEKVQVDDRLTWKPYRVIYEIIEAFRELEIGSILEVLTNDDRGLLTDLAMRCPSAGHELLRSERQGEKEVRSLIRKGEVTRVDRTMTVIMFTASLEHAVYPLDKASPARCWGWM